jgi:hypothetical protein
MHHLNLQLPKQQQKIKIKFELKMKKLFEKTFKIALNSYFL